MELTSNYINVGTHQALALTKTLTKCFIQIIYQSYIVTKHQNFRHMTYFSISEQENGQCTPTSKLCHP
jgi:hypothetical protein